jgi:hypothetical protein
MDKNMLVTIDLNDGKVETTVPYAVTADRAALARLVETFRSGAAIYGRRLKEAAVAE